MLMPENENDVRLTGNISNVDIKNGQNGPFGSITIALDDSYTKRDQGQQNQRVERTHFAKCKVSDSFFKRVPNPEVGARISIRGKIIVDSWKDSQTQQERTAQVTKILRVTSYTSKSERNQAKQMGWYGNQNANQNNQQQGGFQQNQPQGGFQQNQPQGGFQQNQPQGGFNRPQGGYNWQQQG